jgi:hypothetical protein
MLQFLANLLANVDLVMPVTAQACGCLYERNTSIDTETALALLAG